MQQANSSDWDLQIVTPTWLNQIATRPHLGISIIIGIYLVAWLFVVAARSVEGFAAGGADLTVPLGYFQDPIYNIVTFSVAAAVASYSLWSSRVGSTFKYLFDNQRFRQKEDVDEAATPSSFEKSLQDALSKNHKKWYFWATLVVGVILLLLLNTTHRHGLFTSGNFIDFRTVPNALASVANLIKWIGAPFLWVIFGAYGLAPLATVSIYINRLLDKFQLDVAPEHPDKGGGLLPLSTLTLLMILPLIISGLMFTYFSVFGTYGSASDTSNECDETMSTTTSLVEHSDGSTDTVTETVKTETCPSGQPSEVRRNLDQSIIVLSTVGLGGLVLASFYIFVLPLWHVHLKMQSVKAKHESDFAEKYTTEIDKLREHIDQLLASALGNDPPDVSTDQAINDAKTKLSLLQEQQLEYPTWPINLTISLSFLVSQLPALIGLVVNISKYNEFLNNFFASIGG